MKKEIRSWKAVQLEVELEEYINKLFDDKYNFSDIVYKDYDTTNKRLKLLLTELERLRNG